MKFFKTLISAAAVATALSPLTANANSSQHYFQKAGTPPVATFASQLAANSKGRPGEFTPATSSEVAVNSKGRPAEFAPVAANQVAANSKGRPAEFNPSQSSQVAANSKGRPGEFAVTQKA